MSWWNPFAKSVDTPKSPPSTVSVPTITVEGLMNGSIYIKVEWPRPKTVEQARDIAHELGNTMYLINSGELFSTLVQATAVAGNQSGMNDIANAAIDLAQRAMMSKNNDEQANQLVVSPHEVLKAP